MPELRQQRRVVFSARARIKGEGTESSVVARVHNLSERGIYVTAPRGLQAGERVRCRLFLGEERRILRGKVAWVAPKDSAAEAPEGTAPAPASPEVGAGIEFLDLSRNDSELLRRLVTPTPDDERNVDVWFSGMAAPVKCRAVVSRDGLRLQTRLPFLRLGSAVKISVEQHGVRESRQGVLDAVVMAPSGEDGVPRLFVSVSTPEPESAQGTIEARSVERDLAEPVGFVPSTLVDEVALGASSAPHPMPSAPSVPTPAPVSAPVPLARTYREQSDKTVRVAMPLPPQRTPSVERLRRWFPLIAGAGLVAAVMIMIALPGRAPAPVVIKATPVAAAAPTPAPAAPAPAIQVEQLPEPAAPADEAAPANPEAAPGTAWPFELAVRGGVSEIFVPLVGSTKKARTYALKDPPGVAVTVPRAHPAGGTGRFPLQVPGVTMVWIDAKGAGAHVRVHVTGRNHTPVATLEPNGIRVRVP